MLQITQRTIKQEYNCLSDRQSVADSALQTQNMVSAPDTFAREFKQDEGSTDDTGRRKAGTSEDEPWMATKHRSLMTRCLESISAPPLKYLVPRFIARPTSVTLNQHLPATIGFIASPTLLMYKRSLPSRKNGMCRMMLGIQKSYIMVTAISRRVENHDKAVAVGCTLGYHVVFCGDDRVTVFATSDGRQVKTLTLKLKSDIVYHCNFYSVVKRSISRGY